MKSSFPSFEIEDEDIDDCIICGKLLQNHSQNEADQCYNSLVKGRHFLK